MALSKERIEHYENLLKSTKGFRDVLMKDRTIPAWYRAYSDQVSRSEITVDLPSPGIPVTCYVSEAKNRTPGCPVHINIHGGGFYYGHSEDDDLFCARTAAEIRGIVVDVDYALTPSYPFPTAFDQCYAVARRVFSLCGQWNADPSRVSMGGQSAGGNLTAAVALKAAGTGDFRLCLQVLDYPALDFATPDRDKPTGFELSAETASRFETFAVLYSGGSEELLRSPYVSPSVAPDELLDRLPAALIVTGGRDPLRWEAEQYGLRLVSRGVKVTMKRFLESRHAFTIRMSDEWQESQRFIIDGILTAKMETGTRGF